MRLQQLVYFVKVVETGGANSAARELFVSQPAVSAGIRELEEELGIPLFRRVRQQMILTDAGLAFYQRIAPLLRELDLAVRETKASGENQDSIRLCLPPMIGMFLVPRILGEFSLRYPRYRVLVREAATDNIQKQLLDGQADLGLIIGESQYNVGLEQMVFMHTRYALFVGQQHPLASRKFVTIQDLGRETLVLFDQGLYINSLLQRSFRQEGVQPNILLKTNQINTIKDFVRRSAAVTFLIREAVDERDCLVEIPSDISAAITIAAVWKKEQRLSPADLDLLKFLQKTGRG